MASISALSGSSISAQYSATTKKDGGKLAEEAFAKLDTGSKGYIDKADLESAAAAGAASGAGASGASAPDADAMIKALDSSGDGTLSKQEFTDGAAKLGAALESQYNASRVDTSALDAEAASGETGETGETGESGESGEASAIGGGSAAAAAGGSSASTTYEVEDKNEDGTVSEQERAAYKETSAYLNKHPEAGAKSKTELAPAASAATEAYASSAANFAPVAPPSLAVQA